MGKVVTLLSYLGIGLMLAIILVPTNLDLDKQDLYFVRVVAGLSINALMIVFFSKTRVKWSLIDGAVLLFFLYLFVNCQVISQVDASAKWFQSCYLVILYGLLRIILPYSKIMKNFVLAVILFCGLWESILGLMQILGFQSSRHSLFVITGTFFNPGPYGGFLGITLSVALGFMLKHYQRFVRLCKVARRIPLAILKLPDFGIFILSFLSFSFSFVVFFSAMSRAAILGLLISVAVMGVTLPAFKSLRVFHPSENRSKKIVMVTLSAILLLIGMGVAYFVKKESAHSRLFIWNVSCRLIDKHPLVGHGFGAYLGVYKEEAADYFRAHPSSPAIPIVDVPDYGFNEYLHTGVETGIVGLLLLASILFGSLYRLLKTKNIFSYGLIVMMVFAFFSFPFSQLPFLILIVLFVAVGAEGGTHKKEYGQVLTKRVSVILFCLVLAVASLGLLDLYKEKVKATEAWKQVRHLYNMQRYQEARVEYAQLYPLLKDNPRFLFEYGHSLHKTERYVQSNAILKEGAKLSSDPMFYNVVGNNYKGIGDYIQAEESYLYAFEILPNRIYPLYLLMKLYMESNQKEKAYLKAQQIVDFSPKIDSPAAREMKREANALLP